MKMVLDTLKGYNVVLNSSKFIFKVKQIVFLGHILSDVGIVPAPEKIETLKGFRAPETVDELRSFLELVTYVGRFISDLATHTHSLREVLKSDCKFYWNELQEDAFQKIKNMISDIKSLGYYDSKYRTQIIADASPVALGAVLVKIKDGVPRIISYASKSLTKTEMRYCQTEKEARKIERFYIYVCGLEFELIISLSKQYLSLQYVAYGS